MNEKSKIEKVESENVVDISISLDENDRITFIACFDKNHIGELNDLLIWLQQIEF